MTIEEIEAALTVVREERDLNARALLMAGLVSELFRERGFEPVIVGGSAIEFYTDGAYMSGDTDICWAGIRQPSLDERGEIMRQIPGIVEQSGKSWRWDDLWIDLLGEVDHMADKEFARIFTPFGEVVVISIEDALVGRVYAARCWTGYNADDDACAKKLMAAVLRDGVPFDWTEAQRVAESSKYHCWQHVQALRGEVEAELAS